MIFNVLTIYKDFIEEYKSTGVIGRGVSSGAIQINVFDIRDYTTNKHGKVDDTPYGGGAGMVMTPQPVYDAVMAVKAGRDIPVIYFTPKGKTFNTSLSKHYARECEEVILLCGHFEGIDQRAIDLCVSDEISLGDYIITGGHIASICFIDSVARYISGVLGNDESTVEESFENGLLECNQYTRPYEFMGKTVPDILLSGHHENIRKYKDEQSLELTKQRREDLFLEQKNI